MTKYLSSALASLDSLLGLNKKLPHNDADVLFIDMVDPDNVLTALCFAKISYKKGLTAHIVCTGRPVSFDLARFNPKTMTFKHAQTDEEQKMDFKVNVREAPHEKDCHSQADSELLLASNIVSLTAILQKDLPTEVFTNVVMYTGLIAPVAGLSHAVHDYEDLFTKVVVNAGSLDFKVLTPEEYLALVSQLHEAHPAERRALREKNANDKIAFGKTVGFKVHNLVDLEKILMCTRKIRMLVGGPCTALAQLLRGPDCPLMSRELELVAMMCSLPEDQNLLGDNFNIKTDPEAFDVVFFNTLSGPKTQGTGSPHIVDLIPTGVCKQGWLNFDSDQIMTLGFSAFSDLHTLWTVLKRSPQPMFDVVVLFPEFCVPFKQIHVQLGRPDTSQGRVQLLKKSDFDNVSVTETKTCFRSYTLELADAITGSVLAVGSMVAVTKQTGLNTLHGLLM